MPDKPADVVNMLTKESSAYSIEAQEKMMHSRARADAQPVEDFHGLPKAARDEHRRIRNERHCPAPDSSRTGTYDAPKQQSLIPAMELWVRYRPSGGSRRSAACAQNWYRHDVRDHAHRRQHHQVHGRMRVEPEQMLPLEQQGPVRTPIALMASLPGWR